MKKITLTLLLAALALLASSFTTAAFARGPMSLPNVGHGDAAFTGTRADLVGQVLPQVLTRAGTSVELATPSLTVALQKAFLQRQDYQWSNTFVKKMGPGKAFTVTLPNDLDRIRGGEVVIGVIEDGTLVRVLELKLISTPAGNFQLTLTNPDGTRAAHITLGVADNGEWLMSARDLLDLAVAFYPANAKGTFDPLIDTLEGILNMLYEIKGIINMAICAVNELIEMFEDLNLCGWGETRPGGGAIVALIVCTIQDVTEALGEITNYCL